MELQKDTNCESRNIEYNKEKGFSNSHSLSNKNSLSSKCLISKFQSLYISDFSEVLNNDLNESSKNGSKTFETFENIQDYINNLENIEFKQLEFKRSPSKSLISSDMKTNITVSTELRSLLLGLTPIYSEKNTRILAPTIHWNGDSKTQTKFLITESETSMSNIVRTHIIDARNDILYEAHVNRLDYISQRAASNIDLSAKLWFEPIKTKKIQKLIKRSRAIKPIVESIGEYGVRKLLQTRTLNQVKTLSRRLQNISQDKKKKKSDLPFPLEYTKELNYVKIGTPPENSKKNEDREPDKINNYLIGSHFVKIEKNGNISILPIEKTSKDINSQILSEVILDTNLPYEEIVETSVSGEWTGEVIKGEFGQCQIRMKITDTYWLPSNLYTYTTAVPNAPLVSDHYVAHWM